MRLSEAKRDHYRKLAKEEGYSSRASYKLLQIHSKQKILRSGHCVIDFGCAPGGWLEVASKEVSDSGRVIGIDKKPMRTNLANVELLCVDVCDASTEERILGLCGRKGDVVLSDLAPNVSGIWEIDHGKQIDLCKRVVEMLPKILAKRGTAVLKVFEGPRFKDFLEEVRRKFAIVTIEKPLASRGASSEFYLVCKNYLA